MTVDLELVAIGISLLAIILWNWISLNRINKKLDDLRMLFSVKDEEDTNHTDCTKTDN